MDVQPIAYVGGSKPGHCHAGTASGQRPCIERLAQELGLTAAQSGPWRELAAALRANARLLSPRQTDASCDLAQAFGSLEQRLAKLSMMQAAAARFLTVLEPHQRQSAERLLPLCCLRRVH